MVCEFSHPTWAPFRTVYSEYLMRALPPVARAVSSNPEAYVYLAESIRAWPDQRGLADVRAAVRLVVGRLAEPLRRHRGPPPAPPPPNSRSVDPAKSLHGCRDDFAVSPGVEVSSGVADGEADQ